MRDLDEEANMYYDPDEDDLVCFSYEEVSANEDIDPPLTLHLVWIHNSYGSFLRNRMVV